MADETRVNAYIRDIECMIEDFSHWNELTEFEKLDHSLEWTLAIEHYRKTLLPSWDQGELDREQTSRLKAITQWLTEHQTALDRANLVTLETNYPG